MGGGGRAQLSHGGRRAQLEGEALEGPAEALVLLHEQRVALRGQRRGHQSGGRLGGEGGESDGGGAKLGKKDRSVKQETDDGG